MAAVQELETAECHIRVPPPKVQSPLPQVGFSLPSESWHHSLIWSLDSLGRAKSELSCLQQWEKPTNHHWPLPGFDIKIALRLGTRATQSSLGIRGCWHHARWQNLVQTTWSLLVLLKGWYHWHLDYRKQINSLFLRWKRKQLRGNLPKRETSWWLCITAGSPNQLKWKWKLTLTSGGFFVLVLVLQRN